MVFSDPLHDEFATVIMSLGPYGGGDIGEIEALAPLVCDGDDGSFFDALSGLARRRMAEGDAAAAKGHRVSAQDCYLRAVSCFCMAYHPLYGLPLDPRLVEAFHGEMEAFDKAVALFDAPGEKLQIPYEDTTMPAYFLPALGHAEEVRPLLILSPGWDSTLSTCYLEMGAAALRRGYHVLVHDGPGQGQLLIDQGIPLRHDWENVVTPVVDAALEIDLVDPDRIAFESCSLGGYFAPRAAAYEHRLAAIIADPGQLDVGVKFFDTMKALGLSDEAYAKLPAIDPDDEKRIMAAIEASRPSRWKVILRGFWTNGATDLASLLVEMAKWKLRPEEVAAIRCPTFVGAAESDYASTNAKELYDGLTCPKTFVEFKDADGAGMHCEQMNRSLANRVFLDWLDETLDVTS
ncbi:MAG: alpha/beta fold hydrolase [Actinomycetota bacterium]|nr:alpha/beta fold hydrolase [Actinomycetota bacterium]